MVASPGWSSGRKASGIVNVCSCSVVLNITETLPVTLKRLPMPGRPRPADAPTLRKPATPGLRPASRPVETMIRPVASP